MYCELSEHHTKKYIHVLVRDILAVLWQLLFSFFNRKDLIFSSESFVSLFSTDVSWAFIENENRKWILQFNSNSWCNCLDFRFFLFCFVFLFQSDCQMIRKGADILNSLHYLKCVKWRTLLGHRHHCIMKIMLKIRISLHLKQDQIHR